MMTYIVKERLMTDDENVKLRSTIVYLLDEVPEIKWLKEKAFNKEINLMQASAVYYPLIYFVVDEDSRMIATVTVMERPDVEEMPKSFDL